MHNASEVESTLTDRFQTTVPEIMRRARRLGKCDKLHYTIFAASEIAGVRGVMARAIDEDAARFYEAHGFVRSPLGERVMLMGIEAVRGVMER